MIGLGRQQGVKVYRKEQEGPGADGLTTKRGVRGHRAVAGL